MRLIYSQQAINGGDGTNTILLSLCTCNVYLTVQYPRAVTDTWSHNALRGSIITDIRSVSGGNAGSQIGLKGKALRVGTRETSNVYLNINSIYFNWPLLVNSVLCIGPTSSQRNDPKTGLNYLFLDSSFCEISNCKIKIRLFFKKTLQWFRLTGLMAHVTPDSTRVDQRREERVIMNG